MCSIWKKKKNKTKKTRKNEKVRVKKKIGWNSKNSKGMFKIKYNFKEQIMTLHI